MSRSKNNTPKRKSFPRKRKMKPYATTPGVHKNHAWDDGGDYGPAKKAEAASANRAIKKRKRQLNKKEIEEGLKEERENFLNS